MSKIIGNPVGTTLPKSDWKQNDPTKGDYIKNKPEVVDPSVGEFLTIKTIDEDGNITEFETVESSGSVDISPLTDEELDAICDFDGEIESDVIPVATKATLGCVVAGDGVDIDENGVISMAGYIQDSVPIGSIVEWNGDIVPENWLLLNGQAVSRTGYAELFALYGTKYGEGDGSTTFNLPDYRKRVPVGMDETDTDFDELGNTGGEKEHILTEAEMPKHRHNKLDAVIYAPTGTNSGVSYNSPSSTTVMNTDYAGGDQPHNNLQPYIVTNFIVKAKLYTARLLPDGMIVDSLTSNSSTDALSALQGKLLNEQHQALLESVRETTTKDLLWENASPASAFAAQTVSLDLSEYDAVEIIYSYYANSTLDYRATVRIGKSAELNTICNITATTAASFNTTRQCSVKNTGVTFTGGGYKYVNTTSYTAADTYSVPFVIYGIRSKYVAPDEISFRIGNELFIAKRGMTWEEWVNSGYSPDYIVINSNSIKNQSSMTLVYLGASEHRSNVINENRQYTWSYGSND